MWCPGWCTACTMASSSAEGKKEQRGPWEEVTPPPKTSPETRKRMWWLTPPSTTTEDEQEEETEAAVRAAYTASKDKGPAQASPERTRLLTPPPLGSVTEPLLSRPQHQQADLSDPPTVNLAHQHVWPPAILPVFTDEVPCLPHRVCLSLCVSLAVSITAPLSLCLPRRVSLTVSATVSPSPSLPLCLPQVYYGEGTEGTEGAAATVGNEVRCERRATRV